MKFKTFNCPECGEPARGSVETIKGCAEFSKPDEDGTVEYAGETDVWWDEQKTVMDTENRWKLICQNGHDWFSEMEVE